MWQNCSPGFPYSTALHPGARDFPIKSLALLAHVSPWTINFRVLDKSPVSGPGTGPLSYNIPTLGSLAGALQIRLTEDRVAREKQSEVY